MDESTKEMVEKIIDQNDKIIDAIAVSSDKEIYQVFGIMLENNGTILDGFFPGVRFVPTDMMNDEPPMMQ